MKIEEKIIFPTDISLSSLIIIFAGQNSKMYNYQEYNPDIRLSTWIRGYWSATEFSTGKVTPQIFPGDSDIDLIFTIDKTKGIAYNSLFGISTKTIDVEHSSSAMIMFGIYFKPVAITAFTRIPINEFTDREIELAVLETLFDRSFYETLPELQTIDEMIVHTNRYLVQLLPQLYNPDQRMIHAVNLLSLAKGQLDIAELASIVCLSQRQLERSFKNNIGVSPKVLARTFRFSHAQKYLIANPHKSLTEIAETFGYYDHTHFINEFKALSGDTPAFFREEKSDYYADRENNDGRILH
jgi:AraC-like DNA-binding protein